MSELSIIAQSILDKAFSEAKRNDAEFVGLLHLLAGLRRWHEEIFDQKFPNTYETIVAALKSTKGSSTKVKGLESGLDTRMAMVSCAEDAWRLASELVAETEELRRSKVPTDSPVATEDTDSSILDTLDEAESITFGITSSLVSRLAELQNGTDDEAASQLLTAAHAVAKYILRDSPSDLPELIKSAAGYDVPIDESGSLQLIIRTTVAEGTPASERVATQIALALIEVAEWAASLDTVVTSEETDKIDDLRLLFRKELPSHVHAESPALELFEQKFEELVGMESVKSEIRKRIDFLLVSKRREKSGIGNHGHRMHMAFVGNPGTGKTTVARLFGELLHDLGLLPSEKFVETDRTGLIGEYVGHTEAKTLEKIESADGGVLFVDEAYALDDGYSTGQKGYGAEATNCLIKQMEDRRDRLVVILAGYRNETLKYMKVNPGMESRVPTVVDFPDYSTGELLEIALRIASAKGLTISESGLIRLKTSLDHVRTEKSFGNARTVENLMEAAERNIAARTAHLGNLATERELRTIEADDIPATVPATEKRIGFYV